MRLSKEEKRMIARIASINQEAESVAMRRLIREADSKISAGKR